ncbi:MAG: thioredoxin fold domain-containing protein [Gammaproteobacteria bacterium]|nr:thioredoxin fold domain-containing protein [Gammaproteobacteria bacterium]MDH5628709.1 thioredoxin fold domain-containing protein [Gammaproteobacteria bacterium]
MKVSRLIGVLVSLGLVASIVFLANYQREQLQQSNDVKMISSNQYHQDTSINTLSPAIIKHLLEQKFTGIAIDNVELSPLSSFYQVFYSGEVLYISTNGKHVFSGSLIDISGSEPVNYTAVAKQMQDALKAPERKAAIDDIDESEMIIFKSKQEKFVVTIFTDVDCAYCRRLHREMPLLNDLGVTVRYLAYPRAGVGSGSYNNMVSIWCSEDRQTAMTMAKNQQTFGNKKCEAPVSNHLELTRKMDLNGTPAIILADGELIAGYMPAEDFVKYLNEKEARE